MHTTFRGSACAWKAAFFSYEHDKKSCAFVLLSVHSLILGKSKLDSPTVVCHAVVFRGVVLPLLPGEEGNTTSPKNNCLGGYTHKDFGLGKRRWLLLARVASILDWHHKNPGKKVESAQSLRFLHRRLKRVASKLALYYKKITMITLVLRPRVRD